MDTSTGFSPKETDQMATIGPLEPHYHHMPNTVSIIDGTELRPGQCILADCGFIARDLIAQKSAFLTIPSFLRGASKLTGQQAMETRTVASVRIRVKNAMKRLKDFRLLSAILPNRMNKRL